MSTSTSRARHRDQREATRREILATADRFLRERPYRELSVEVVMEGTGLTRTAFYRHFDDVTALVLRLMSDIGEELLAVSERWTQRAGDADYPAPAHEGLAGIVDFFVRHGPLVRAIAEAATTDDQVERGYRALLERFIAATKETIDRLAVAGRVEVGDSGALARALNLMNEAYLLEEFGREPVGDPAVALATLETIWLRVLGSG